MESWRLIVSPPGDAPTQMAFDQAIAEAVQSGNSPPTLRFYTWLPLAISLGYGQSIDLVDRDVARTLGVDVVRRVTGGEAILHSDELTYSVTVPRSHRLARGGVLASYFSISQGLLVGLESLGLAPTAGNGPVPRRRDSSGLCFATPSRHEIWVDGHKVVGSAQGRVHGGVLQHGSVVLSHGEELYPLTHSPKPADPLCGLRDLLPQPPTIGSLVQTLTEGFAAHLHMSPEPGRVTAAELSRRDELVEVRYANNEWLERA